MDFPSVIYKLIFPQSVVRSRNITSEKLLFYYLDHFIDLSAFYFCKETSFVSQKYDLETFKRMNTEKSKMIFSR